MSSQQMNDNTLADFSAVPLAMQNSKRWLVRVGKVPFYANGKPRGRTDTPEDWAQLATLEEALRACRQSKNFTGIGFALGPDGSGSCWQGIDLDKVSEHRELKQLMSQPNSYSETSPSDNGIHIIGYGKPFKNLGPKNGCEAYSSGRFFTFTGKSHGEDRISDISPLVEKLARFRGDSTGQIQKLENDPFASYVTPNVLRDLRSALAYIESDDRQIWVECAHALKALEQNGKELWLEWSARSHKFDPSDAERVWDSVKPSRMDFRWVFSTAQQNGWANPLSIDAANEPYWTDRQHRGNSVKLVPIADLVQNLTPPRWLIQNYLEDETLCLLFGDPGSGKSFLAIDWALSVATGQPWAEYESQQGPVIYIAGEGHTNLAKRFLAWGNDKNVDIKGLPVYFTERSAPLTDERAALALATTIDQVSLEVGPPRLLVIDTLHRNFGDRDENSAQDFGAFVQNIERYLLKRFKATVLVVHHSGHGDKKRSRGSSSIKGSLDWEYSLEKIGDQCQLVNRKVKDHEPPKPLGFKFKRVEFQFDQDQNGISSLVLDGYCQLQPEQLLPDAKNLEQTKGFKEEALARGVLEELLTEHRGVRALADSGRCFVERSLWRKRCFGRFQQQYEGRSDEATRKAVGRAISRVLTQDDVVIEDNLVGLCDDPAWDV
jgi:hypothetical protein